ncbi:MAG: hypothetical protein ACP5H0_07465, partial [Caldisericum sp.]
EGTASFLKLCGQTIKNNPKQQDPDNILKHNKEIIKTMKNMNAFKKPVIIAIDWHDIMYYGNPKTEGVKGTKTKKGTNWAYQFATAAVVVDDRKLTIAVTPVAPHESIVEHVKRLLSKIFELEIKINPASRCRLLHHRSDKSAELAQNKVHNDSSQHREV